MRIRKIVILLAVIGSLFLGGCIATPYYGGTGYYRSTVQSYGYQPSFYGNYSTIGGYSYYNSGHRHSIGGYGHFGGGHKHFHGGHRGGGHRGGHHR